MRNNVRVLRRLGLLLAVLMLLCLAPGTARANSAYDPFWKTVTLSNAEEVASIALYVDGAEGSFHLHQTYAGDHTKEQTIHFQRPDDVKRFYIEVTLDDGTVRTSEPADATGNDQKYTYDVKTNALKQKSSATGWLYLPLILLGLVLALAVPLGFTVLVEFLVAIPFRLKPYRYVVLINLITNLVMNVLLYLLRLNGMGLWIVALLEVAVVLVEYLFYTKKYKDHPKGKLLLFSLIANALSWGLFELVQRLVF